MALEPHLIALVLVAAISHACWNALVKSSAERAWTMTFVLLPGGAIGLAAVPFLEWPRPEAWWYLLGGMVLHNVYYAFLLAAYRVGDLSQVYPIARGMAPMLVAAGAWTFADEVPPPPGLAGLLLASAGIMSLALARRTAWTRANAVPVAFAAGTGCFIAGYTVVDGLGVRLSGAPIAYIMWLNILKPLPLLAWWLGGRPRRFAAATRRHWRQGLASGMLALFAYSLVLYALAYGAMAPIAALRETSMIFAAAIGALVLREGFGARRVLASVLVCVGVSLLTA